MSNRVYLGILGDPAKIELYADDFYEILQWDESHTCYYLLGASERDVKKVDFRTMYQKITDASKNLGYFSPIPSLTDGLSKTFRSRVGLFPSSAGHLIDGPEFTFSPYPINSTSTWLKFKSRFLTHVLQPFVRLKIIPLGYHPMGGKAATRTKSDTVLDIHKIKGRFIKARRSRYLKWHYLEGGSGESFLGSKIISSIFNPISEGNKVIDRVIYGGGINSKEIIDELFDMVALPQSLVIGNISETNISMTYTILERVIELNESLN